MRISPNLLAILALAAIVSGCLSRSEVLYVSPDGKPLNPGTREAPFSSPAEALEAARKSKTANPRNSITIHLAPGEYHLTEPINIGADLSGLTLEGDNQATIRGSVVFTPNWQSYDSNILVTRIDEKLTFDQLVVDGKLQVLARYPDYNEKGGHLQGHAADALAPERIKTWKNPVGAIFNAVHAYEWGDFHYVITGIDAGGQPILSGGHQNNRPAPAHPLYRMIENVFEELDAPGEWFLDRNLHRLYYWPPQDINPHNSVYEAVILKNLISIQGNELQPVRDVSISGIRFEYSGRTILEPYEPLLRSDWTIYRGGALFIAGAENCSVRDCEFTNLGGNALFISGYNRGITIAGNHIHECGASGICFVGDTSAVRSPSHQYSRFVPLSRMDTVRGPRSNAYPKDCQADDNLIYRTGRIEKQTAGVQIAMAMNIRVSHNSIYEVPRAGINIGDGTWGGHILEYNDVFNTVLESGDHGSFNSWGRDRFWHPDRKTMDSLNLADPQMPLWDAIHTTIIRNNRFRCDHGWDIDLDDGSSNYHIYNNLCLNGGLKLREGFYRVVENNIMVNNSFHPHVWFVNSGDIFRKNIVTDAYKDIRLDGWGKELDYNLFPDIASLEKARSNGTDANSQAGNPMFVIPAAGDYSVSEESPAIRLGFQNFPMDQFGVKSPALKAMAKTPELPHYEPTEEVEISGTGTREWLGATIKSIETMEERSASGLGKTAGVLLLEIRKNSVAEKAGLQKGDVILRANGNEVATMADLLAIFDKTEAGRKVELTLFRNQTEQFAEILNQPSNKQK